MSTPVPYVTTELTQAASLRFRLQAGVVWNLAASVANQGGTFLINILLANLLGVSSYGQYAMAMSTLLTLSTVAQLATGSTVSKYVAEYRSRDKARAASILALCKRVAMISAIVSAVAVILLTPWLTGSVLHAPQLRAPIIAGSIFLALSVLNGFQVGALSGLESYRHLAGASVAGTLITIICCVWGCYSGGITGAVIGLDVGMLAKFASFSLALQAECRRQGIGSASGRLWDESRILYRFALPGLLSGLTAGPGVWAANTFLIHTPGGFTQLGIYTAAYSFSTLVLFLPWNISNVVSSLINNQLGLRRATHYRLLFWTNCALLAAVTAGGAIVVHFLGSHILRLFGKAFVAGGFPVLDTLILALIPEALTIACCQFAFSKERVWTSVLTVNVPRDSLYPLIAYFLASRGAAGLATSYLISRSFAFVLSAALVARLGTRLTQRGHEEIAAIYAGETA